MRRSAAGVLSTAVLLALSACAPATPRASTPPAAVAGPVSEAEAVVQRQLEAYNARDVEAFAATYAEDAVLQPLAGGTEADVVRGRDAIRRTYAFLREAPPGFRVEIVKRVVTGNFVIDQERVIGLPQGPIPDVAVVYEVRDGLIRSAWFVERKGS